MGAAVNEGPFCYLAWLVYLPGDEDDEGERGIDCVLAVCTTRDAAERIAAVGWSGARVMSIALNPQIVPRYCVVALGSERNPEPQVVKNWVCVTPKLPRTGIWEDSRGRGATAYGWTAEEALTRWREAIGSGGGET